ncbi:hypothetical protein [Streptomyces nanshensis]|uniref:hypothetical protein n=1 Tax=Streptomyces nanshensis TaxID=518642 RepID=UPI001495F282|nr:hypothetical protein [Streptomyces nanshensis]
MEQQEAKDLNSGPELPDTPKAKLHHRPGLLAADGEPPLLTGEVALPAEEEQAA